MDFIIRTAEPQDAEVISHINVEAWTENYKFMHNLVLALLDPIKMSIARKKAYEQRNPNHINLVTEIEGKVVGFCEAGPLKIDCPKSQTEIYTLYIDKAHQKQGLGRALITHLQGLLPKEETKPIAVGAFTEHKHACNYYTKLGGEYIGTHPFFIKGHYYKKDYFLLPSLLKT